MNQCPTCGYKSNTASKTGTRSFSPLMPRVKAAISVNNETGCWVVKNSLNDGGYPTISYNGKRVTMSRAVMLEINGPVPGKNLCCHKCDNRLCVNPDHLYWGTHEDNTRDKVERGRCSGGKSKLTDAMVGDIRVLLLCGTSQREIALKYGVNRDVITNIKAGKTRKKVQPIVDLTF